MGLSTTSSEPAPPVCVSLPMTTRPLLEAMLERRLSEPSLAWLREAAAEIAAGADDTRFAALLSLASRHAKREALAPDERERAEAAAKLEGWDPERWTVQETARVLLVLSRPDLGEATAVTAIEEAFRFADEGELCALYRSLGHMPDPERFTSRASEGCRTNMVTVFEAVVLDTPFPVRFFDDLTWRQAVIKCVFIGVPLWRLWGLDGRLDSELARMALDLAEERRSAHREVQHELWLTLGAHGGERGIESLELELGSGHTLGRRAAAYGLARAGETERLKGRLPDENQNGDDGELVAAAMTDALAGNTSQTAFRALDPR